MDPSSLRSQIYSQQAMGPTNLSSGLSYYTLESLEGASSLPFLKPAPPGSVPRRESLPASLAPPFERLDAQARALVADRELLDARGRILVAEREALLRNVSGGESALQDQRRYADGLPATDARARFSFDGFRNADGRGRALLESRVLSHGFDGHPGISSLPDQRGLSQGLDMRARESLQPRALPGVGGFTQGPRESLQPRALPAAGGFTQGSRESLLPRALPVAGGLTQGATQTGSLSELLRARELGVGNPFAPVADPALAWRDIPKYNAEVPSVGARNVHLANGSRDLPSMRFGSTEGNKYKTQAERNKGISIAQQAPAVKPPAPKFNPEQSEGWCADCKVDCLNTKTLAIHFQGKKHKAAVQGKSAKVDVASTAPSTSQADKKRASDAKPDLSQIAKRLKASSATAPQPVVTATEAKKAKLDAQKVKPTATSKSNIPDYICKVCNITTTGKANLDSHMSGKRHAARVKELANPQLVSAT